MKLRKLQFILIHSINFYTNFPFFAKNSEKYFPMSFTRAHINYFLPTLDEKFSIYRVWIPVWAIHLDTGK